MLCSYDIRAFRSGHTWYTKKGTHVKNKGFLLLCCQGCEAVCLYVCHVVSALCMLIKIEALVIQSCFAQFRARLRVEMIWPCSTHSHFASLQQSTRTLAMASTPLPGFVDCKQRTKIIVFTQIKFRNSSTPPCEILMSWLTVF